MPKRIPPRPCKSRRFWIQSGKARVGDKRNLSARQVHPQGYVDLWSLEEFEGVTPAKIRGLATHLLNQIPEILGTPLEQRERRE
jgi:hypothetical protein